MRASNWRSKRDNGIHSRSLSKRFGRGCRESQCTRRVTACMEEWNGGGIMFVASDDPSEEASLLNLVEVIPSHSDSKIKAPLVSVKVSLLVCDGTDENSNPTQKPASTSVVTSKAYLAAIADGGTEDSEGMPNDPSQDVSLEGARVVVEDQILPANEPANIQGQEQIPEVQDTVHECVHRDGYDEDSSTDGFVTTLDSTLPLVIASTVDEDDARTASSCMTSIAEDETEETEVRSKSSKSCSISTAQDVEGTAELFKDQMPEENEIADVQHDKQVPKVKDDDNESVCIDETGDAPSSGGSNVNVDSTLSLAIASTANQDLATHIQSEEAPYDEREASTFVCMHKMVESGLASIAHEMMSLVLAEIESLDTISKTHESATDAAISELVAEFSTESLLETEEQPSHDAHKNKHDFALLPPHPCEKSSIAQNQDKVVLPDDLDSIPEGSTSSLVFNPNFEASADSTSESMVCPVVTARATRHRFDEAIRYSSRSIRSSPGKSVSAKGQEVAPCLMSSEAPLLAHSLATEATKHRFEKAIFQSDSANRSRQKPLNKAAQHRLADPVASFPIRSVEYGAEFTSIKEIKGRLLSEFGLDSPASPQRGAKRDFHLNSPRSCIFRGPNGYHESEDIRSLTPSERALSPVPQTTDSSSSSIRSSLAMVSNATNKSSRSHQSSNKSFDSASSPNAVTSPAQERGVSSKLPAFVQTDDVENNVDDLSTNSHHLGSNSSADSIESDLSTGTHETKNIGAVRVHYSERIQQRVLRVAMPTMQTGLYVGPVSSANQPEGIGSMSFANGDDYFGPFSQGDMHGTGAIYVEAEGNVYKGDFRHNLRHGRGQYISATRRYVGQFEHGRPHGEGTLYYLDGSIDYEGQWVFGQPMPDVLSVENVLSDFVMRVFTDYQSDESTNGGACGQPDASSVYFRKRRFKKNKSAKFAALIDDWESKVQELSNQARRLKTQKNEVEAQVERGVMCAQE